MVESDHTDQACEGCPEYNPFDLTASEAIAKANLGDTIQGIDGESFIVSEGRVCYFLRNTKFDAVRFRVIRIQRVADLPRPVPKHDIEKKLTRIVHTIPPEASWIVARYKDGGISVLRKGITSISYLMPTRLV
jgi:hypothetical protein